MEPQNFLQKTHRLVLSKVSYRPRRIVGLLAALCLALVTVYHFEALLSSERVGHMYAHIEEALKADPSSVHKRYLQAWRDRIVRPPKDLPYNLTEPSRVDFSRGQSRVVLSLSGKKTKGYFLDVGAGDGERNSVSLSLELQAQWDGLLVEGDLDKFRALLTKHRRAGCLHARIWFGQSAKTPPGELDIMPTDLLQMTNRTSIDLLSINLHGQELDFLWAINLQLYAIKIVVIEMQGDVSRVDYSKITEVMTRSGYRVSHHIVDGRVEKKDIVYTRD